MAARTTYLERYLAGEHEPVWDELTRLGAAVREESVYRDALAVARETMLRVRHNIDTLIPRLSAVGYTFGYEWPLGRTIPEGLRYPLFTPPAANVAKTIAALERRAGVLPLSLRAFYEIVGGVNFVGEPPATWSPWCAAPEDLDALYVYPAHIALEEAESWQARFEGVTDEDWDLEDNEDPCDGRAYYALPRDCWLALIAPDEWLKYDFSGCGEYQIALPNLAADARLLTEPHRTTFVNYLRICLRWAGFPKLEQGPGTEAARSVVLDLTRDLLPI
jgi:hypothetical protein